MKEPYGGAVATDTDPKLCVGGRKGADEALAGARAGGTLSREIRFEFGVPTLFPCAEGNTGRVDSARCDRPPRGLRPHACTEARRTGTGRTRIRRRRVSPSAP